MKPNKTLLSRDDTCGAAYGYRPLIDFVLDKGGAVGNYSNGDEAPFHTDKTITSCTLHSNVTRQDLLDAFEFEEKVTLSPLRGSRFALEDKAQWLRIIFDTHASYLEFLDSKRVFAARMARQSVVSNIKEKAFRVATPVTAPPKGRVRIGVKPWRDPREAYYPVIEFAIAQGCLVNKGEALVDSYFVKDGDNYICQVTGDLPALVMLNEFGFDKDVIVPDTNESFGYVVYDQKSSIMIFVWHKK